MSKRIDQFRSILKEKEIDGILLQKPENRFYASGFTGTTGYVLITNKEAIFITDFRYTQQAMTQCIGYTVVENSKTKPLSSIIKEYDVASIGFEDDFATYCQYMELKEKLENVEFIPLKGAITKLRAIKSSDELQMIEKAAAIGDLAFQHIQAYIKAGVRELDIALELEHFMKKQGASKLSFDSIVASGNRSSLPHGVASEKLIEEGDFVTLDFGCVYKGYCSDMTRTVVVGKTSEKQKEIYNIVLEAQKMALEAVKPGITGKDLDDIARNYITEKGYGQYFGHGLGHGVGLEIHELPHVNSIGEAAMEAGMVITDEPGIYIPDFGGVRIEDLVAVTETGYKVLSKSTKELIEL
ncbi:M24 family metallopeptidase [Alkaliphilus serpentinus]|uniref:Aminopeptidase P family protein n=1 Tax=Alkaliphilus serpentinus TaxID=1482731 RepID=A0A833MD81_9FIRM|nr:Xaa-Pro peptidase family protein [Alkaliphilus serpentinus]KAB3527580.1 aminopeptidase P family protein [Alkaliphilus serpentinus]